MSKIDKNSLYEAVKFVKNAAIDAEQNIDYNFNFSSFKVKNHSYKIAAIDGSHHNLKGLNFFFSTLRAGYLLYQEGKMIDKNIDDIKIEFISKLKGTNAYYEYVHEKYYQDIIGDIPKGKLEFDKVAERIRTLLEWEKVRFLIEELSKDDMIIFDGSLISGEISTNYTFYDHLVKRAKEKGIALVGLSKDTSLSINSISLPLLLNESSRKHFANKNWYVEHNDTFFVKFSKHVELIFRIDAVLPDHLSMEELLSRIGAYCFDPATLGYPFPMQAIHDGVRISEMEIQQCLEIFKIECGKQNIPTSFINQLFSIYHDQLDKISWGR